MYKALLITSVASVIAILFPPAMRSSTVDGFGPQVTKPTKLVEALKPIGYALVEEVSAIDIPVAPEPVAVAPVIREVVGDSKAFIYMHESGNNPTAINSLGCRGLGQACPGSKLPCGDDYDCQDNYFTKYMIDRYGSWENAAAFWRVNNWW